ncbi:MAG: hypothetical protein IJ746_03350 [Ruminococcus sp.]|nr:hypothetical protein [Ruminococcus sp.]
MKKNLLIICIICFCISLISCQSTDNSEKTNNSREENYSTIQETTTTMETTTTTTIEIKSPISFQEKAAEAKESFLLTSMSLDSNIDWSGLWDVSTVVNDDVFLVFQAPGITNDSKLFTSAFLLMESCAATAFGIQFDDAENAAKGSNDSLEWEMTAEDGLLAFSIKRK